ncbi:cellobiose phosphorylase [Parabacteroides sp. PF5-5]|uniref:GH36-type glycosyl hydrolase domain-containing protein n=1 Tax=unclassified Parabacteroides TaxID=2649774 RepID=UPI002474D347|nr:MULTISPECIES: glycosyl hydrolase family 65 protein [unclassified Parabacteroides]MDH6306061.1 cellobiose phosphorylase [Parabacteroides sp. PH5-39]MDH6317041.1 cellobiose phosphorylase [Parabacteroides sp. PF5-13]MDH6320794.1 cellobiose phosphorylase [Parabacteroides sp. PH5-13]MDH6324504.1 cellobiose phosphorylase [Parabacteroides sp. PH5-8]MDH6328226.1 cellobiose phosphorylase [Parabacteroides sp. PH5-41]
MKYKYGYFNETGTEFTVTDPKTPRAFDNFMWNDSLFSSVHQTGVGFLDYQIGDTEAVQLLTGIGRICDFDVFGRENLMSRLIYVRDNDTGVFWNVNWEPVKRTYTSYKCTHGLGYTIIQSETEQIASDFRIFVPKGKDPVELWTLGFSNQSSGKRNLSIFIYNQIQFSYKWGFNSYGDMFFRTTYLNKDINALVANKHPHVSPHNFQTAFMAPDREIAGFDGSRDAFVGLYSSLNEPQAVVEGKCSGSIGSSDATVGVLQFDLILEAGQSETLNMVLGITESTDKIATLRDRYLTIMDSCFKDLKQQNQEFINHNYYQTPDEHLNRMLNIWIKHQTNFGSQWCRWGWMGYRDIVQHGYGVSSFNPTRTKEILQMALRHQYANGMALRGWNPVDTKAYSDSALWLVFTLVSYLKETADFDFLQELIAFFDEGEASVLEHIERALGFLEANKGSHRLCLIKFGDWNDSLTGIGKEGRGESVWLSMAYAEALRQMIDLFAYLKDTREESYRKRYNDIKQAINETAWDGEWYVRCYDDNGRPVGSALNKEGKIFLNAQSWSMIAGIADEKRTEQLIQSANMLLKTEIGYLLLAPTFMAPDPHIGRISFMEPGICENGTVYSHVNIWMILGLLRAGRIEEAYAAFKQHSAGYVSGKEDDPKLKMPPYIYANGCYGSDHKNHRLQMEFTWITGSVAWFYNVLSKEMIGIQPDFDRLVFNPRLPAEWDKVMAKRTFRGKHFEIQITRTGIKEPQIELNGKRINGNAIKLADALENNLVNIQIP